MINSLQIDKFLLYSIRSNGYDLLRQLNLKYETKILKILQRNFARFWNLLSKEQQIQYVKLSLDNKEFDVDQYVEQHMELEKIIRYCFEASNEELKLMMLELNNFYKTIDCDNGDDVLLLHYDEYAQYINYDNEEKLYNVRHDILKFWMSLEDDKKIKFINIVKEYWEKNEYHEYKLWTIESIKEDEKFDISSRAYEITNVDLLLTDKIKYLDCSRNQITKLDNLPSGLEVLICDDNPIKSLNNLPLGLKYLSCVCCDIIEILNLPKDLRYLDITNNLLETIKLPNYIEELKINMGYTGCNVRELENIPIMIKNLELLNEQIIIKSNFPFGMEKYKHNDYIIDSSMILDYVGLPTSVTKLDHYVM